VTTDILGQFSFQFSRNFNNWSTAQHSTGQLEQTPEKLRKRFHLNVTYFTSEFYPHTQVRTTLYRNKLRYYEERRVQIAFMKNDTNEKIK